MISITGEISISEDEIELSFVRSGGPGGQNVNKVATSVQLRFDIAGSPSLPEDVRERLLKLAGKRVNAEGRLIINAGRYRTQESNRRDAVNRLVNLIGRAAVKPRIRRPTKPTVQSKRRRIEDKKEHGRKKELRRGVPSAED